MNQAQKKHLIERLANAVREQKYGDSMAAERDTKEVAAARALGAGVSVPHPRRQTNAEYVSRWRRKNGLTAAVQRKSSMKAAPTALLASMMGVSQ